MTKVTIIGGAGTLGAAVAYQLASNDNIHEICLIDINENLLMNHVLDLQNGFPHKRLYNGAYDDLVGSDIVVITAGIPNRNDITSRDVFLEGNLKLFEQFGAHIKEKAKDALIITASNPVDVLNYYLNVAFGFEPRQLIGYTRNDSLRFEWALRKVLSFSETDKLFTPVIGEHGNTQVPLYSKLTVNGRPLVLNEEEKEQATKELREWFVRFNQLNINRTTGWTTAIGMSKVIEKLLSDEESETTGSAILHGEYGVSDVSLGVPIVINKNGIQRVVEWEITDEEREAFQRSAAHVKGLIETFIMRKVD